jgi:cytochrome c peroxidase
MNRNFSGVRGASLSAWMLSALLALLLHGNAQAQGAAPAAAAVRDPAAAVELGRMLFFDPKLSKDKWVSCASCHQPGLAMSDGVPHARGVREQKGVRNTPTLLDVGEQRSMFWDGRRASLEDQALDPLLNSVEHGLADRGQLMGKLRADPRYEPAFQAAYGLPFRKIGVQHVAKALATFQRTLVSGTTPFDRFLAGQADAMPPAALRGWAVFDQEAQCTRCHVVGSKRPLLTDHRFHAQAAQVRELAPRLPALKARVAELHRTGKQFSTEALIDPEISALGRYVVTRKPDDVGRFKTPGLRNVALTAPYMHDGSIATLADALDSELKHRGLQPDRAIELTAAQREDLLAFLQALTGQSAAEEPEPDWPVPPPPLSPAALVQ